MREMHKWKDKVEFSLDNRQIFFLFFGLSVVGCFVFALGVMTGRRLDWEPDGEVAALGGDSLDLLDHAGDGPDGLMGGLTFKQGLEESGAAELPATRDPELPPREEKQVKAEKKAKQEADEAAHEAAEKAAPAPAAKPSPKPAANDATLASAGDQAAGAAKVFTLQMKAFSRADEAEQFADKLRRNGHDVRVEQADVRGRAWHRVRLGRFTDWNEALGAKAEFEKAEHVIAYVVSE
jgi:cell division septation protein DedD